MCIYICVCIFSMPTLTAARRTDFHRRDPLEGLQPLRSNHAHARATSRRGEDRESERERERERERAGAKEHEEEQDATETYKNSLMCSLSTSSRTYLLLFYVH